MKIAIQSSVFLPTPAPGAGALEYLVSELAPRLQRRGHEVTLYALRGSRVPGVKLVTVQPYKSPWQTEQAIVDRMEHSGRPDVLFDHSRYQLAQARWSKLPAVTMIHGNAALERHPRNLVFVSLAHGRTFGVEKPLALHVSIDVAPFTLGGPMADRGPALWMGRIMPYKRPHLALEICQSAGVPLVVAGPVLDKGYWARTEERRGKVTHIGEIGGTRRSYALSHACCLLMTSEPQEPAGLVMLEAMASGTPVFAFNEGAAPEYVEHGKTGWLSTAPIDMERKLRVKGWDLIDPAACRQHVEDHFSLDAMAEKAEALLVHAADGVTW